MPGGVSDLRRTSNPAEYTALDGVYVTDVPPPSQLTGVGNDVVCVIGEFQKGPVDTITAIASQEQFNRVFGGFGPNAAGVGYKGAISVRGKQFARLRIIRISNATQVTATANLTDGVSTNVAVVTASSPGVWGNSLSVQAIAASDGNVAHFDLQVSLSGNIVEWFRNLVVPTSVSNYPIVSDYIVLGFLANGTTAGIPKLNTPVALLTGADGTFADGDYVGTPANGKGIQQLYGATATEIRYVFLAEYATQAANSGLYQAAITTGTKIAILGGLSGDTYTALLTNAYGPSNFRSDRAIFVFNHTLIFFSEINANLLVSPVSIMAAILSGTQPGTDPAGLVGSPFMAAVVGLAFPNLGWSDYQTMMQQGMCGLEYGQEVQQYKFRSGVVTSLVPGSTTIARRTVADYIINSFAFFLPFWLNRPYTLDNQLQITHAMQGFMDLLILQGIIPDANTINAFNGPTDPVRIPYIVDRISGNSPTTFQRGLFVLTIRVQTLPAMRFIATLNQIGETVTIIQSQAAAA